MSFNEQNQNQNQNQPSLVGGHAEYVKGAAEVSLKSEPAYLSSILPFIFSTKALQGPERSKNPLYGMGTSGQPPTRPLLLSSLDIATPPPPFHIKPLPG